MRAIRIWLPAGGRAFSGPKHWPVFDLIATTDVDSPILFSPGTAPS